MHTIGNENVRIHGKPESKDILGLLIKLLADQEGVEITYEIKKEIKDGKG